MDNWFNNNIWLHINFFVDEYLGAFNFINSGYAVLTCWLVYKSSKQIREKSSKIILCILIGLFIQIFILNNIDSLKEHFYQPFKIPSRSMAPTLIPGGSYLG